MKGATISCSIRVSNIIEDSITISDTNGNTYHQSYRIVSSNTISFSDDINTVLEASVLSTKGNTISHSELNSQANAAERTITYMNSKFYAKIDTKDITHTTTHEESYAHTVNEEHSHARTDRGSKKQESNWSKSEENSHTEEYSRMDINDYNAAKNTPKKREVNNHLQKRLLGIGTDEVQAACEIANIACSKYQ